MIRGKLPHSLALRIAKSAVLLERLVNFQKPVIDRPGVGVEDHLNHAVAFIHRLEQRAIACLALSQHTGGYMGVTSYGFSQRLVDSLVKSSHVIRVCRKGRRGLSGPEF